MENLQGNAPRVSVIIPLYNKGPTIARAIRSVLDQEVQNFEIIVVDGGSTDIGPEEVRLIPDPRISLIRQEGKGVSGARNEGVSLARSDFIAFLDADDEWMPHFISTVIRLRERYPDAGIFFCAVSEIGMDGDESTVKYSFVPSNGWEGIVEQFFRALTRGDPLYYPSSMAIRKKTFQEFGGFPDGFSWGEDQDLVGRIALRHQIAFSSQVCSVIHKTGDYNQVMCKRIAVSPEHPFLQSAAMAMRNGEVPDHESGDLRRWIATLTVFSARYNLIAGYPAAAGDILKKYDDRIPLRNKIWFGFWSRMPEWTFNIGGRSLFNMYRESVKAFRQVMRMRSIEDRDCSSVIDAGAGGE